MVTAACAPRGKLRIAGAADDSQVIRSYSLLNGTA